MKRLNYLFITLMLIGLGIGSCEDWTETKSKYEPESIPVGIAKDDAYYANLRAWKATMFNRRLSWGWFGGWTGYGSNMVNSMAGLPDSLDIVALWGNWSNQTDLMKKDLEIVQKIKGTKVVATELKGDFYWLNRAPKELGLETEEEAMAWFGWEGDIDPHDSKNGTYQFYTDDVTPAQEAAIRKYARRTIELIIDELGYDGYDLDWESQWTRGSCASYDNRLYIYVDEMSKYIGPLSGSDKLLIVDGYVANLPARYAPFWNLYVIQAYSQSNCTGGPNAMSDASLNTGSNRFSGVITKFLEASEQTVENIDKLAKRILVTENYECGLSNTGGSPLYTLPYNQGTTSTVMGMALWKPQYNGVTYDRNGGFGAYHIEYEYSATGKISGYYPWIRDAIQAANPASIN